MTYGLVDTAYRDRKRFRVNFGKPAVPVRKPAWV
jgi:hypothetical protein